MEKNNTKEVRERLLLKPELTLDAALVIAMQVEHALLEPKLLNQESTVSSTPQVATLTRSTAKSSKQGKNATDVNRLLTWLIIHHARHA